MRRIRIQGGRVIDPANGIDRITDLCIADGHIVGLGSLDDFHADETITAEGLIVCPGLIDLSARLREPGLETKATIASESAAAAAGGITTLCCPPDTDPVVDNPAVAELIRLRAEQAGKARVVPIGALTQRLEGQQISEMHELHRAGCAVVGQPNRSLGNSLVQRRAFEYAASCDLTVFLRPLDPWLGHGCAHEGPVATRLGLPAIPESAETIALARDLLLIEQTGVRAHFCQLSSARACAMVAEAQARGLPVSADVAAHHLHLCDHDIGEFDTLCHVLPPLRSERDRDGLCRAVADGVVGAICSDHQPHDTDAKLAPFSLSEPGISGLETLLPLALRLCESHAMPLPELIARLTSHPARILAIDSGHLSPGASADLCLFDPEQHWVVEPGRLHSRGHNTPFTGWELKGRVRRTLLAGRTVFMEPSA